MAVVILVTLPLAEAPTVTPLITRSPAAMAVVPTDPPDTLEAPVEALNPHCCRFDAVPVALTVMVVLLALVLERDTYPL